MSKPGFVRVGGAAQGLDARLLAELAAGSESGVLHVARDDARMALMAHALGFFAPSLEILTLPAWDCLPYDRVSPNPAIASRRLDTLSRLAQDAPPGRPGGRVLLATVNAVLQRLPTRGRLESSLFRAATGERLDQEALNRYLARHGYRRVASVMEPGDYAVRGGLIDLYPPGAEEPLRLDLFGDQIEGIRRFDPLTQRSTAPETVMNLVPMSEVPLDEESIQRFRTGYRQLFGAVTDEDPLYAAISEGRKQIGMEHWLPLFNDRLETLFDFLPGAAVTLDPLALEARDQRLAAIADYYEARVAARGPGSHAGEQSYKPLPPGLLYLDAAEWDKALSRRAVLAFDPHTLPPSADVISAAGRPGRDFAPERAQPGVNVFDAVREHVGALRRAGRRVVIASFSAGARDRLALVLADHAIADVAIAEDYPGLLKLAPTTLALIVLGLENGFEAGDLAVISEQDILGDRLVRPRRRMRRAENFIAEASMLAQGDIVVHVDHGIGRYTGLQTLTLSGAPHDCLLVIYDGGDKLYVPVENIEVLSRYGSEDAGVVLDRLGGAGWQARKARLKARLKDMADDLIRIAATRQLRQADRVRVPQGLYDEFCARFPFEETEDQERAITETLDDLGSGRPMDRLVCGDVGFGKTEVALRAAFATAMNGKQVALVCPTTLLARQHFRQFADRFHGLPVRIGQLSRLVPAAAARDIKRELADGRLDIVVGTHALLGKGVAFKDLGLVIVDEEQHFGVKHKERLKQLRSDVHVLTLTATPIPRTLQLALSGVRELSLIATAPVDRLAVRTFVLPFDPLVLREAILRERYRGGQCFYVCPRIEDLAGAAEFLRQHVPEVRAITAHGQLAASELEDVMSAFYEGRFDVLVSTNIVESGLDIPAANTLIVHRADLFGLAQLYQLRGRVGRSKLRAYAYFTLAERQEPSVAAQKRLRVLQTLDTLGAGFTLASHDLDLRGAGNLLGEEQSGHIREVGFELYQQMLEEAVATAKSLDAGLGADAAESWSPQINLGTAVLIPEEYVADLSLRLDLYRRIARLEGRAEIDAFAAEMIDRFGPLPRSVEHLLQVISIKSLCRQAGIDKLEAGPRGATVSFRNNQVADPAGLVAFISRQGGAAKLRPDHRLVLLRGWEEPEHRVKGALALVQGLAAAAGGKVVQPVEAAAT